jgi:hypothetical protein
MTAKTIPALTPAQAATVEQAREVLAQPSGTDAYGLAKRVGALEWWLGDILALVAQLAESTS